VYQLVRTAGDLGLVEGFLCVFVCFTGQFVYFVFFCVFGVFSPVCFELSIPVQVIAWKDSSPKWPIIIIIIISLILFV